MQKGTDLDWLGEYYGRLLCVIECDGRVAIGMTRRRGGHPADAVLVPGGQALRGWFERRRSSTGDARAFLDTLRASFTGDVDAATLAALRAHDPLLADLERLYLNGVPIAEIAALADLSPGAVRARIEQMRRLGFEMPFRRVYAARGVGARFDRIAPTRGSMRLVA